MENCKMIKAYLFSFSENDCAADKWDYGLLKEIFDKYEIEQVKVTSLPQEERAIVVVPGPQNIKHEEYINQQIQNISRLVLFINGDEEGMFDINKIKHSNAEIWVQYPYAKHNHLNKLPIGTPKHIINNIPDYPIKKNDVYFSGQINHQRRKQVANIVDKIDNCTYTLTDGFAKGGDPKDYYKNMSESKIVLCPAGVATVDSFRLFESIEMLSLPIADQVNSRGETVEFYDYLFSGPTPMPKVYNWNNVVNLIPELIKDYPANMHRVVCWWIKYKRDLGIKIMEQVNE